MQVQVSDTTILNKDKMPATQILIQRLLYQLPILKPVRRNPVIFM
jgi:hypothetical protein